jgi:hypothetical protein
MIMNSENLDSKITETELWIGRYGLWKFSRRFWGYLWKFDLLESFGVKEQGL